MSKSTRHEEKMKKKRAIKTARRDAYKALAGTSKKSKRQNTQSTPPSGKKHAHAMLNCGNPGCQKCGG